MGNCVKENLAEVENILLNNPSDESNEFSNWLKQKTNYKFNGNIPKFAITNNYIYWCDLGINIGSEQNKLRPVLIINTSINSNTCTIVPLTSKRLNDTRWYHIDLECQNSTVLLEQLRTVSKIRILSPYRKRGSLIKINRYRLGFDQFCTTEIL